MEQNYEGYVITLLSDEETWEVKTSEGDAISKKPSLKAAKNYIDGKKERQGKAEFAPIDIFELNNPFSSVAEIVKGKITSINEKGKPWISNAEGRRKAWSTKDIFLDTPENRIIASEIMALQTKRYAITQEINAQMEKLAGIESLLKTEK